MENAKRGVILASNYGEVLVRPNARVEPYEHTVFGDFWNRNRARQAALCGSELRPWPPEAPPIRPSGELLSLCLGARQSFVPSSVKPLKNEFIKTCVGAVEIAKIGDPNIAW